MTGHVVVVGGGVIGAACAYYLSKAGWSVTILDRGDFGKGCSHGNCGFVCPSHVLPLAVPGAIRAALKAIVSRDAPFSIKPRLDPALWGWLIRFARRCNVRDMMEAGRALQALLNSSRALYDQLMKEEAFDCDWETRGLLVVFLHREAMEHHAESDRLLRESFNMGAERYDGDRLNELEPALKPGLAGGWLYKSDAHLRPDKLMSSWRRSPRIAWRYGSRALRDDRPRRGKRQGSGRCHGAGRDRCACVRRCDRGLDAAAGRAPRLPRADPAGEGILDHHATAGEMPEYSAHL